MLEEGRVSYRTDLPDPEASDGETTVGVLRAGICATDLALARGYMNFAGIPGHEFVGRALDGPLKGQRVVGEINAACGSCVRCVAAPNGRSRHCAQRSVLGILGRAGAFAERLTLPHENLHAVPDNVPDEFAVFAEPLAAAFEIVEQLGLSSRPSVDRALVLGDGRLGLLCAQVLASVGLHVAVAGRHPERALHFPALRHIGGIPGSDGAGLDRWPLVVEATGDPDVLQQALGLVQPCGTLVLKTTAERPATLDLAGLVVDEITLLGSRCGPFEPAVAALSEGTLTLAPMIHGTLPLEEGVRGFERAARSGTLKIELVVGESCHEPRSS